MTIRAFTGGLVAQAQAQQHHMLAHRRPQAKKNNQPMTYEALLAEVKRKEELEKENAKPKKAVSAATKPQDIEPLTSLETKPKTDEEKKKTVQ